MGWGDGCEGEVKIVDSVGREIYIIKKTSTRKQVGKVREFQKPLAEATIC